MEIRCKGMGIITKYGADNWHHISEKKCYTREGFRPLYRAFFFHFLNGFFDRIGFDIEVGTSHLADDGIIEDYTALIAVIAVGFVLEYKGIETIVEI